MSRPRLVSDHDVFTAFDAAIAEHGPNGVTLGLVAQRLGVTAPALIRRFGSKQGLFAAFMQQQLAAQPDMLRALVDAQADPMQALLALSGHSRPYSVKRTAYLRHLASFFLQLADDPTLVPVIAKWFEGERRWITERLTEALAASALRPETPVADLARTLQAALHGARLQWATGGKGTESTWSRREMDAVLAPWRKHASQRTP
ncbi:TetR/AcrR family transcriptional regulator [Gemmatimonas groenlandica]|uniref:TetR/AcrR family transcriptional regulator n=1 Tax=Gemmatimonas groenlandica TaxID=2732249 RepID=A0A6M4IY70_9BACT|nr:TetR/AcrR family transcriptional regulator [Gemmatimonas groenlandica]QJR37201.1 TetR/AcrR family transcriptional regulator [Gemmatimonas groenlandica]